MPDSGWNLQAEQIQNEKSRWLYWSPHIPHRAINKHITGEVQVFEPVDNIK
jgi:hypothetical protein